MKPILEHVFGRHLLRNQQNYEHALRETVHRIILIRLWRAQFFEHAAFYGGSALHMFYDLDRISEHLDFTLTKPDLSFDLHPYLQAIEDELSTFGFTFQIERKEKISQSHKEAGVIKGNTIKNLITAGAPANIIGGFHTKQKLRIKIELDTDPPEGAEYENKFLVRPVPFSVRLYTLPTQFAAKIHAILCRPWKNRVKGRDLYDFVWYIDREIPCRLEHLKFRLIHSGHWDPEKSLNPEALYKLLEERFDSVNFEEAVTEVRPFIKHPDELALWSKEFFIQISREIQA